MYFKQCLKTQVKRKQYNTLCVGDESEQEAVEKYS